MTAYIQIQYMNAMFGRNNWCYLYLKKIEIKLFLIHNLILKRKLSKRKHISQEKGGHFYF